LHASCLASVQRQYGEGELDFRLLGPLEVWERGRPLALGGTKQRALLAILLLHANEVVSRDLLIDELWGTRPPPSAPHTLETYVSRLRKTLHADRAGQPVVLTRPPGYMLRVGFGQLDLHRFERLLEEGRRALATHAPERAATKLREALALWRGRALADVEFEDFARVEIDRLDELRLQALEERIEAELALGQHEVLVPELESLVAQHPLRERLRGQLMLALYRSGRQAEALQIYRETRGYFVEELGLEPGPALRAIERAILHQDEVLAQPERGGVATATPPGAPPPARKAVAIAGNGGAPRLRPRRNLIPATAAAAGIVAAAVAVPLALLGSNSAGGTRAVDGDALALVGPNGKLGATVPLAAPPTRIAAGLGSLWATSSDGQTVEAIDPKRRVVRDTIHVGSGPSGIAVGSGAVWVANSLSGTISRIDPGTGSVVQTIPLGARPADVAAGNASVWVAIPSSNGIVQIDANTGRTVKTIHLEAAPTAVAFGGGAVWVASAEGRNVSRVDPSTDAVTQTVSVGGGPSAVAYGAGALWVANSLDGTVSRIDPVRGAVQATIRVGNGPNAVTVSREGIWVGDQFDGFASLIDPRRNVVVRRARTGGSPTAVVSIGRSTWIAVRGQSPTHRGGTLVLIASVPSFETLDPRFLTSLQPAQLRGMTNDGLVTFEHVGESSGVQLVPDLAVSLPAATGGARSYSFRLRSGIRYSTGRLVRASDVRPAIEHLFEGGSPGASFYSAIVGAAGCAQHPKTCDLSHGIVTGDGGQTVTFRLTRPDPDFLYKLALPFAYVLPAATPARDLGSRAIPATGPYEITSYRPGHELRLARNPAFHEWSRAAQPNGFPDAIVWKLGVEPENAVTAIERGRADWMLDLDALPANRRAEIATRFAAQLHEQPLLATDFFVLNTTVRPFDDLRVRRALNEAVNRRAIVALYGGPDAATPTCQILPPEMGGYRRYCPYRYDLDHARRLVAASGTRGMTVLVWDTRAPTVAYDEGVAVVRALRRIGYRAALKVVSEPAFQRTVGRRSTGAQVISGGWGADYPTASDFIELKLSCREFRPNSDFNNNIGFCDPAIDRRIDRAIALQVARPQAANRLWARIDHELVDRAVWLPTVTPKTSDFVSRRVGNYQFHPLWGVLVDQLWVR
jgi:peptide/nickel transport system substrate-binding protein